jgi:hypothetical protein
LALAQVERASDFTVMSGPFRGMRYVPGAVGSHLHPKLLGTYERELHPLLESFRQHPVETAFDIGAAEGYYAVGMLFANLALHVVAFESNPQGQALLTQMAELNGVGDRLSVFGACSVAAFNEQLNAVGDQSSLVMIDVEGFESLLLDPIRVPVLKRLNILVEVHDFVLPGLTEEILARFRDTHAVERFDEQPRRLAENTCLSGVVRILPRRYRMLPLNEYRPCRMHWLWLTARQPTQVDADLRGKTESRLRSHS